MLKSGIPFPGENIPRWTSRYSSITISLTGVGYANSGMNEKGLAIGHMALISVYPGKDDRPVIDETQWIQYMLDNCANTNEVIEESKKIRITQKTNGSGTHYFIADPQGRAAIIEFINGRMVVHTNENMPYMALCNDTYEKSMNDIKNYQGFGGNKIIPEKVTTYDESSPMNVMAIGCTKINQFYRKESNNIIQDAFDIHYAMSGPNTMQDGKNVGTQYTTVFDLTNRKLYFKTLENSNIREVDLNSFEDDCSVKAKMLNILTPGMGNVTALFVDYSPEENMLVMHRALSTEANKPPQQMLDMFQQYIDSFECSK
jgi:choloylglycine hydrolase